jgi:hypothetical protein
VLRRDRFQRFESNDQQVVLRQLCHSGSSGLISENGRCTCRTE